MKANGAKRLKALGAENTEPQAQRRFGVARPGSGYLKARVRGRGLAAIHDASDAAAGPAEQAELCAWLRRFSTDRPRWGCRRAAKMARQSGWQVNK